jgi:site-specific recombinase XerD
MIRDVVQIIIQQGRKMVDLTEFQTWLSINVGTKSTINYTNQMKGFFLRFSELTQETLNQYLSSKVDKWAGGSYNAFFKAIRQYMKFTKTTIELPAFKTVEAKPRAYFKEDYIQDIISKFPIIFRDYKKVQCIFELLFMSGMRPKELINLKRENVNIEERKIILVNTKTFKSRVVFITDDLAKKILYIFEKEVEKENAFNLNETSIQYYGQTVSKYLNIKFNPYKMRHSYSHNFLKRSGNNLIALSDMLGHTNLSTTQLYCNINEKELHDIYDKAFNKRRKK